MVQMSMKDGSSNPDGVNVLCIMFDVAMGL